MTHDINQNLRKTPLNLDHKAVLRTSFFVRPSGHFDIVFRPFLVLPTFFFVLLTSFSALLRFFFVHFGHCRNPGALRRLKTGRVDSPAIDLHACINLNP